MEQQRGRRRLGEARWRELLQQFDQGDDTIDVFCEREGVARSSFQRWRSRIGERAASRSAPGAVDRGIAPSHAGFVELGGLRLASSASAQRLEITLDLGGGVTLRVARG